MSGFNREELYQQVILDHNKNPKNFHAMEDCTCQAEGYNPLCGDHYQVYLKISPAHMIEDISFEGQGCAISKASASLMTVYLKGKTVEEALPLIQDFHQLILGKLDPDKSGDHLGKLALFAGVAQYPSRVKCASLCWHTVKGALNNEQQISTE